MLDVVSDWTLRAVNRGSHQANTLDLSSHFTS